MCRAASARRTSATSTETCTRCRVIVPTSPSALVRSSGSGISRLAVSRAGGRGAPPQTAAVLAPAQARESRTRPPVCNSEPV
jgi:hypothetical protein